MLIQFLVSDTQLYRRLCPSILVCWTICKNDRVKGKNEHFKYLICIFSCVHATLWPHVFRCVRQERISIRGSVRPSVRMSVTQVQKPRFSIVFGHCEILYWNKWSTNMFWEPPLLLLKSFHPSVCPSISRFMSHDQYTQRHSPDASLPGRACYFKSGLSDPKYGLSHSKLGFLDP